MFYFFEIENKTREYRFLQTVLIAITAIATWLVNKIMVQELL